MVVIKKYGNRRLYDTSRSTYINLEDLATLVRDGQDIQVVDVRTGEDLTRDVLLQVVLEVLRGADWFPVSLLRRIIRTTGDAPVNHMLRHQFVAAADLMGDQLDQVERMWRWAPDVHQRSAPTSKSPTPSEPPPAPEPEDHAGDNQESSSDPELAALRKRLEALEARLKR